MTCKQNGCSDEATHTVYWPNQVTQQCHYHALKLIELGNVMGVSVPIVPIIKEDNNEQKTTLDSDS